ncbi:hypothetical protein VP01_395g6 [Puccinia sorghi]|uniref:Uncharacterized protein n=1 Tax=Puccinia sorghi TaxID=27349 RepID=A0A0L6UUA9_9BASI|nr:hypothetical protein VP01_395g6 [Puccinia sorghi]
MAQSLFMTPPSPPYQHPSATALKAYLRANIWLILLREDLECYGWQMAQKLHSSKIPFALIKQTINTQGVEFHSQHLLPNYADNPEITSQLDSLIASMVKAEKTNLSSLIPAGITNREAAERLWNLASRIDQNHRSFPIPASLKGPKYVWPTFDLYSTSTKSSLPGILATRLPLCGKYLIKILKIAVSTRPRQQNLLLLTTLRP